MSLLRIYFPEQWRDASMPCPWALCDDSGTLLQHGDDLLASLPKADDYVAIIPAERVLCTSVSVPAGSRRRWQAALPFIAEEHTLPDPDENHVVPGKLQDDSMLPLLIVDKSWMRNLIDSCRAAGIVLRRALPEPFLPAMSDQHNWTLLWNGSSGFVRTGPTAGSALDIGNDREPPLALRLAMAKRSQPDAIDVRFPSSLPDSDRHLPHWDDFPVKLICGKTWDWRSEIISVNAPNLLWGEFSPRLKIKEWLPKLRPLAIIVMLVLSIEIIGSNFEWLMLARERNELKQQMTQLYHGSFSDGTAVTNAPLQMQRSLSTMRHAVGLADETDFLPLLDRVTPVLSTLPTGTLRALNYESGLLDVSLRLVKADDFELVQQQLQDLGLGVRIGKVANSGNAFEAKLSLRMETGR